MIQKCGIIPARWFASVCTTKGIVIVPDLSRISRKNLLCSSIIRMSKGPKQQDFQVFAKPCRLLPATKPCTYHRSIPVEPFSSFLSNNRGSLYVVELQTSKDFGSCLRDLNASILLCLIDINGDSILQRVSAASCQLPRNEENDTIYLEPAIFHRGSSDNVVFQGPELSSIEGLWVGLESGSWKLDGLQLTVVGSISTQENYFRGIKYRFSANNIALGEGGASVVELRPTCVTEFTVNDAVSALEFTGSSSSTSSPINELSNKEGMKEYADLKFSLLTYDILAISTGLIIVTVTLGIGASLLFFIGGIGGFLYLLLLQSWVDGLSVHLEPSSLHGFGFPLRGLLLFYTVSLAAVTFGNHEGGGVSIVLTPAEIFTGVAGFLSFKVAVIFAALKPLQRG